MSESQNQTSQANDPNNPDRSKQTAGADDLELAKNPDQFFQTTLDEEYELPAPSEADSAAHSGIGSQSSAIPASTSEIKEGSFLSEFFDPTLKPPTNYDPTDYNIQPPEPLADPDESYLAGETFAPAKTTNPTPKLWSSPESSSAASENAPAHQTEPGAPSSPHLQKGPQTPTGNPAGPNYSFNNFQSGEQTAITARQQRNVPSGFFDDDGRHGTTGGASGQDAAGRANYQYSGGMTAEQSGFFEAKESQSGPPAPGGAGPAANQLQDNIHSPVGEQQGAGGPIGPHLDSHPAGAAQPGLEDVMPATRLNLKTDRDEGKDVDEEKDEKPKLKKRKKKSTLAAEKQKERAGSDTARDDEMELSQKDTISRFQRLVDTPETRGTLMYALYQGKQVFFDAKKFFKKLPMRGNNAESALIMFVYAAIGGLTAGIVNFNLLITLQFVIVNLVASFLLACAVQRILTMMGSQESFDVTFRVIAYSQITLLIAGLKIGLIGYLTLAVSLFYAVRIQFTGLSVAHDVPPSKIMMVVVLSTLFITLVRWKINCL